MKPISDKLQNNTDIYSFVKRRTSPNENRNVLIWLQKMQSVPGRSLTGVKKLTSPVVDMTRFSGKKKTNQFQ